MRLTEAQIKSLNGFAIAQTSLECGSAPEVKEFFTDDSIEAYSFLRHAQPCGTNSNKRMYAGHHYQWQSIPRGWRRLD